MNNTGLGTLFQKDILKPDDYRQSVFSLLLCTLAINILSLALPVMTLQVYDRILPNPGTGTLSVLITGVCLAICLEAILRLTRAYIIGRAGASYEHMISCKSMQKVLNANLAKMDNFGIGEHLHRMGSVGKLRDFYNGHSLTVLFELIFAPIFLVLIYYIGGPIVLVPSLILTVFIGVSLWEGHALRNVLQQREKTDDQRFNFLIESLEGIHSLKAFAIEPLFQRRYEKYEENSTHANYNVSQQTSSAFNAASVFSHLMVASVISTGAWFVLNGLMTTGGLIAVLLLSGRIMQPVQRALVLWTRYQDFLIAKDHVKHIMNTPQREMIPHNGLYNTLAEGKLEIENISFKHKSQDEEIIRKLSLHVSPGEYILIDGEHGSGKTTLLNLITGIYPPDNGNILVDEQDINSYEPETLVKHIGHLRTTPVIFRGTIRENITCFGQTDEEQAKEVAALLDINKEIAKLPAGFDTFLSGTHSDNIHLAIKQRIAITRVLAAKPRIILFDNADRGLDKTGYQVVYSLMARLKGKATFIIITDDQNIRSLADHRYQLKNGTLRAEQILAQDNKIRPYKELRL